MLLIDGLFHMGVGDSTSDVLRISIFFLCIGCMNGVSSNGLFLQRSSLVRPDVNMWVTAFVQGTLCSLFQWCRGPFNKGYHPCGCGCGLRWRIHIGLTPELSPPTCVPIHIVSTHHMSSARPFLSRQPLQAGRTWQTPSTRRTR